VPSSKVVGSKNRYHLEVACAYVDSLSRVEMTNSGDPIYTPRLQWCYLFLSEMCKL